MSRPSTVSSATLVRYSCARWIGLRVWKPTTRLPASVLELPARVRGILRQLRERRLGSVEDGDLAGEVARVLRVEAGDPGMRLVRRAEAVLRLALLVVVVDLLHLEHGQRAAFAVGERDAVPLRRGLHRETDRHRPREPVREVHVLDDALVVLAAHEALERRQRARREHVQIGHLPRRERDRLERVEIVRPRAGPIDQRSPVWLDQTCLSACHCDCPRDFAHAGTSSSTRPSSASLPRISCALSSGVADSVSTRSSGLSGASYGSETPVNSLISPENAFA